VVAAAKRQKLPGTISKRSLRAAQETSKMNSKHYASAWYDPHTIAEIELGDHNPNVQPDFLQIIAAPPSRDKGGSLKVSNRHRQFVLMNLVHRISPTFVAAALGITIDELFARFEDVITHAHLIHERQILIHFHSIAFDLDADEDAVQLARKYLRQAGGRKWLGAKPPKAPKFYFDLPWSEAVDLSSIVEEYQWWGSAMVAVMQLRDDARGK
jgi:hypothetical protein